MIQLKVFLFIVFANIAISCGMVSERAMFIETVEAFSFLSTHHHELHIMIGEEEGDGKGAYKEFLDALMSTDNYELIPIKNAALRIGNYNTVSESVKRLDYLVDYYQSGLSMEIEGILRGYGYMKNFSPDSLIELYDTIIAEE